MHFCKFNLEFIGLGYKPISSTGVFSFATFELYRCKKCKKLVFKNNDKHEYAVNDNYKIAIINSQKCGYKPLGDLIKDFK